MGPTSNDNTRLLRGQSFRSAVLAEHAAGGSISCLPSWFPLFEAFLSRGVERSTERRTVLRTAIDESIDVVSRFDAVVLGVSAALLVEAYRVPAPRHRCHFGLSESFRQWVPELLETEASLAGELAAMRALFQDVVTVGINLRGRTEEEFVSAWRQTARRRFLDGDETRAPFVFALTACAATFAASRHDRVRRILEACGEQPILSLAWFGYLSNAWMVEFDCAVETRSREDE